MTDCPYLQEFYTAVSPLYSKKTNCERLLGNVNVLCPPSQARRYLTSLPFKPRVDMKAFFPQTTNPLGALVVLTSSVSCHSKGGCIPCVLSVAG
jgi:hypothetical protein